MLTINDQCITLSGLKDKITDAFVNDATVEVTVSKGGANVSGETWPLSMPYVAASDGDYRAVLKSTLDIAVGDTVIIDVSVLTTGGGIANFSLEDRVTSRGFDG